MGAGGIRRRLTATAAVLTSSALLALAGPAVGTAQAAALCPGHKVRTLPFSTGRTVVYRSGGYLCAVTLPERAGVRQKMAVSVQARGSRPVRDTGNYTHHAGPVTVHAGHRCVWVRGTVGRASVSSGWILC
ncbi:hypothetical protein ACFVTY_22025 [Streptomyces sp. NPDC058067]|uniref:Secreted protein n=1 Tax=Streptomyces antnestii TaxID=2494256 RepID=A0A437PQN7_9ACTN|nr:hypothetical protein [Streptomyces sp. San01]RVU24567.1 hypothetical protein EOT10_14915 [Streptomyces sp. San01]